MVICGQRGLDGERGRENNNNVHTILSGHEFLLFLELGCGALAPRGALSADLASRSSVS
jgi:hypothetical protein